MPRINACTLNSLDLSSQTNKDTAAQQIITKAKPIIESVIQQVQTDTFDYNSYSWERTTGSGLTNKGGLYLILNKVRKKVYLGGCRNLAQRKGEHKRDLNSPGRHSNPGMRADAQA